MLADTFPPARCRRRTDAPLTLRFHEVARCFGSCAVGFFVCLFRFVFLFFWVFLFVLRVYIFAPILKLSILFSVCILGYKIRPPLMGVRLLSRNAAACAAGRCTSSLEAHLFFLGGAKACRAFVLARLPERHFPWLLPRALMLLSLKSVPRPARLARCEALATPYVADPGFALGWGAPLRPRTQSRCHHVRPEGTPLRSGPLLALARKTLVLCPPAHWSWGAKRHPSRRGSLAREQQSPQQGDQLSDSRGGGHPPFPEQPGSSAVLGKGLALGQGQDGALREPLLVGCSQGASVLFLGAGNGTPRGQEVCLIESST